MEESRAQGLGVGGESWGRGRAGQKAEIRAVRTKREMKALESAMETGGKERRGKVPPPPDNSSNNKLLLQD